MANASMQMVGCGFPVWCLDSRLIASSSSFSDGKEKETVSSSSRRSNKARQMAKGASKDLGGASSCGSNSSL